MLSFSVKPSPLIPASPVRATPSPRLYSAHFSSMLSFPVKPSPFRATLNRLQEVFKSQYHTERGIQFNVGDTFFPHESVTARDLGVLSAALYKQSNGNLRVLDAMCGCGIRSLRYLIEAKADFVLANDASNSHGRIIGDNLSQVSNVSDEERWTVRHSDVASVMMDCHLQHEIFDLIDVSFGSENFFILYALDVLKLGGLLYLTSTDWYSSEGHRPNHSLAKYGAYIRPMPYSNEIGLRMLIGGAVWEASRRGYHVTPLFSYYSNHGDSVFRVMLQIKGGDSRSNGSNYRFVAYCTQCGDSKTFRPGDIGCSCNSDVSDKVVVSGPLWTGPLHDASHLVDILNLADQWGWTSDDTGKNLEKLIKQMIDESDPMLPFGYIQLDEPSPLQIGSRAKLSSPSLEIMINALWKEGYVAYRSHIAPNAIKTNCPMTDCVKIVKQLQQL